MALHLCSTNKNYSYLTQIYYAKIHNAVKNTSDYVGRSLNAVQNSTSEIDFL